MHVRIHFHHHQFRYLTAFFFVCVCVQSSLWGSRRSSWNSLGHAPSLKRRDQSGEHESLLSGEYRDSFEDDLSESSRTGSLSRVSHLESFDLPELLQVPPAQHFYGECNGRLDGSFPSSPYATRRETPRAPPAEQDEDSEEVVLAFSIVCLLE